MALSTSFLLHSTAVAYFGYAIYYDVVLLQVPENRKKFLGIEFAGRWKYLTFWNAVLQLSYFSFSVINDLLGSSSYSLKEGTYLQRVRDYVFGSLGYPLAMFVAATFWGLYTVDRELVFPKELDLFFPSWLNHALHSSIALFALLEMILIPRTFPLRSTALTGLLMLMITYLLWIFFIAWKTDYWVYPVFAVLHWGGRLVFIAALLLLAFFMYFTGELLFYAVHGNYSSAPTGKKATMSRQDGTNKRFSKTPKRKQAVRM